MKKTVTRKPLHLDRETIRQITERELTNVPGGGNAGSCYTNKSNTQDCLPPAVQ
jgi:hypothetical protein